MNRLSTLSAGCLSATLLCAPALASDFQGRWYFGLGGGVSTLEPNTDGAKYTLDETEDTAMRLFIGRDLTRRISLELFFSDMGQVSFLPTAGAVNPPAEPAVEYVSAGLHTLFYLYNSDGGEGLRYRDSFAAYVKLGVGTIDNEYNIGFTREDDMFLGYGVGLEGLIGSGFSWRAEYEVFDDDAHQGTLSLVKRFGAVGAAAAPVAAVATAVATDPVAEADAQLDKQQAQAGEPSVAEAAVISPSEAKTEMVVEAAQAPSAMDGLVDQLEQSATGAVASSTAGDSDGDGVQDSVDRCANTRAGLAVDNRGCSFSGIVEGLYFDRGSADLSSSAKSILDNVVLELRRFPSVVLEVQAHTDNRGSAADNLELSQRRAEAVANHMVNRGVAAERIRARGFGESRPAFRNATEEGRRRNRRVVFQTVEALQ